MLFRATRLLGATQIQFPNLSSPFITYSLGILQSANVYEMQFRMNRSWSIHLLQSVQSPSPSKSRLKHHLQWFSMIFPWFSHGFPWFPMVSPRFSGGSRMDCRGFPPWTTVAPGAWTASVQLFSEMPWRSEAPNDARQEGRSGRDDNIYNDLVTIIIIYNVTK